MLVVVLLLCTVLTLSRGGPINSTQMWMKGPCEYKRMYCQYQHGEYCPECDDYGYFVPWQCSPEKNYCWCVDAKTGKAIAYTERPLDSEPLNCEHGKYCPTGWTYYDDQCYQFISSPKSWIEAEVYCKHEGANLVSVHSYEENYFITGLTKGDGHEFPLSWIGGFDSIYPGYWMWCDGSKFHYDNWYHGGSSNDMYHCVMTNYHLELKWYAADCNDTLPFVCCKSMWSHMDMMV